MYKKLLVVFILSFTMMSQGKLEFSEFKLGNLAPNDAEAGLYLSASSGKMFDANLGYVIEIGLFNKSYTKQERTPNPTPEDGKGDLVNELFEQSTRFLPVMVKLNFVNELNSTFLIKADMGVGYGFLWNSETNYVTDTENSNFFSGFMYQLGADIGIQLSEAGSLYLGVTYNGGEMEGDHREIEGLPSFNVKDMSGVGIRATVRIDGLGIF